MTKRIDDRLFVKVALDILVNKKLEGAPPATKWLYASGLVVSRRDLTDGIVRTAVVVAEAVVPNRHVKDLVDRRLWHVPGHDCARCEQPPKGSAVIHDYLEHNSSKADVEESKKVRSAAGRRGAEARWGNGKSDAIGHSKSHGKRSANSMAESESESEVVVTEVSQSPTQTRGHGLTDSELHNIETRLVCDRGHAERVAQLVISKVKPGVSVAHRGRYVLRAIEAEPELYRPARRNRAEDQCEIHSGPKHNCGGCRADAIVAARENGGA